MKYFILLTVSAFVMAFGFLTTQKIVVTGSVKDNSGIGLVGASVVEKGTHTGTSTDSNGNFQVTVSSSKATLVISCIGYDTKEININNRKTINVVLENSNAVLDDVVVTGYAKVTKRVLTASSSPMMQKEMRQPSNYPHNNDFPPTVFNTEDYDKITENRFLTTTDNPLSTFSIDVDAASYSNVRRIINNGQLPPAGAVRIEEMINYFTYQYPQPKGEEPFSINTEISECPWNTNHRLLLIGLQGKKIPTDNLPPSNLVFLIDVSGSMEDPNKLPLVKASLKMLVDQLRPKDKIALVVYAGAAGLVLPSTNGEEKTKIKDAIDNLNAGGSTAGGEGLKLAYKTARENFRKEGNNRIILCTDGDFNIGESSDDAMERLIEVERKSGVFLTVLGFGMGNYKDNKMQKIADKGNGNHAYIDGITEAKKVLVNEFGGTLFTIAKDVKLQIEFNPTIVQGYRLIGYENRMLSKEDFNDDKKDAGELGSGHTVTALYELIPVGEKSEFLTSVDKLKYQKPQNTEPLSEFKNEIATIKFRYKKPDGDVSKLLVHPVLDNKISISKTSNNFRFAASVASFGMLLRNSEFKQNSNFDSVIEMAKKAKANDEEGYRSEFIRLVESAKHFETNNENEK